MIRFALLGFVFCAGALALAGPAGAQAQCRSGFVWREAFDGDTVCVTPETRQQAWNDNSAAAGRVEPGGGPYGDATCRTGFVWRGARDGDVVCVRPHVRDQVAEDNRLAASRTESVGRSAGSAMGGQIGGQGPRPSFEQRNVPPVAGSVRTPPPVPPPPQRNNAACRTYATGAVRDFQQAQERPRCRIGPDGRWQANFNAHYDWCVTASVEARRAEYSARDRHLLNCGARFTY